jgi:hypothetical protein
LGTLGDNVLDVLLSLDVFANRYGLDGWSQKFPALQAWRVDIRYRGTAVGASCATVEATAKSIVSEVRKATDQLALALFVDGFVTARAFAT